MSEIWHISDHHLGHANILKFTTPEGVPTRGFRDIEHMHHVMVERHNARVSPQDKVYFHGDVAWKVEALQRVLPLMNGKKRLILGNHDHLDMGLYRKHFQKIMAWRQFTHGDCAIVCTHFPLHESSFLGRFPGACLNVHGHIHGRVIPDPTYRNVCVEQTDYTPVNHDVLVAAARRLREAA